MKRLTTIALWTITLTICFGFGAAQAAEMPDPDPIAERVMEAFDIPGMAVAIVKDDELVFARGYGVLEAGGSEPVTPETIFAIGSNSKSFTSAAANERQEEPKKK
ncbi:MAG: serine hydrolase domain-containing protein [Acidobacteriota bacterium]